MKYEKATAEVIYFGSQDMFMRLSSGAICGSYSDIDNGSATCFSVSYTGKQDDNFADEVVCNDVTPGFSPRTLWCHYIEDKNGLAVP